MKRHLGKLLAPTALCLLLAGCAQTGPPLPPSLELPKPPTDLRATRKDNRVTLTWSEPTLTTDRKSVRYIGPTLVCRSLDPELATCGTPVATLPAPAPSAAPKKSSRSAQKSAATPQTFTDALPASMEHQDPSAELTYAVEVLNRNARSGGLSNRVHVSAIVTLPPPTDLSAQLTGDGTVLTWTSAGESRDAASSPAVQHRYRVYRRDESSRKDAIAGEVPVPSERGPVHFTDSTFEWEKTYLYRVTTVSIVKHPDSNSEVQVEGDDTPPVRIIAHDVFPPSVPAGLQAAYSGEGQKPFIDLIWAPVTNADLAGYNVFRSETNGAEVKMAVKLNAELVKSPSYRDFAVASGKTYTYSVSAVDVRGNESQRSEPTSEPVP
ncbi:MAG: hypothetical protein WBQ19_21680 [Terriglobales bacterium]|jgi:hypothetical protein